MSLSPSLLRRDFGVLMMRLGRRWQTITDAEVSRYGLTAASCRPLYHLGKLGDGVRPKDLAQVLDIEPPSLGPLLDRLEDQGLLRRCDAVDDRRSKTLHLTEDGRKVYDQVAGVVAEVGEALTAGISEADLVACLRVLARIDENVEARKRTEHAA